MCKTKVTVVTHLSEEFELNAGVHQGSALSPLLFTIVVDVVTNVHSLEIQPASRK